MKLRDLFLPKIVHSDPKVREKAVQKEKNPVTLENVINNDKDPDIRLLAEMRLKEIKAMK